LSKFEKVIEPLVVEIASLKNDKERLEQQLQYVASTLNEALKENDALNEELDELSEEIDFLINCEECPECDEIACDREESEESYLDKLYTEAGTGPRDKKIIEELEKGTYGKPKEEPRLTVDIKDVIGSVIAKNLISMDKGNQPDLMPEQLMTLFAIQKGWDK